MTPLLRALLLSTAAASTAKGVLFAVSALYFTTVIGLSPATVGAVLTLAGGAGIATAFGAGRLCDLLGARGVLIAATAGQGVSLAVYCFSRTLIAFCLVACLAAMTQAAQRTAQATLLAQHFTGPDRVATRARLRVATNIFVGLGSALAAIALTVGTARAYTIAMLAASALVLVSLLPLRAIPPTPPHPAPPVSPRSPLRDRRYVTVAALNGVMTVQFGLLTVGMPLWVTTHTTAPAATVALLLVLNTVLVTLFQIPASRLVPDVPAAGRTVLLAALLLLASCLLYAAAAHGAALLAVTLLVLAVVAHTAGEILSEAGAWELAFELADHRRAGAYQGISQTGFAAGTALAPALTTATAITHGTPGWVVLGALFVSAGAATHHIATRPHKSPPGRSAPTRPDRSSTPLPSHEPASRSGPGQRSE
ncbi:MFS transporter [Actinoplanes sp. NPDC051861]|uniref:MFS transporter n=1 Tax=Actinoplanes sp. NPDC051861 TaxID=3155170 RepID=UPI003428C521